MFLKIWQNSQENTCGRVSLLIKLPASASGILVSSKIIEDKGDDENWNYKRDRQVRAFLIRVLKACNFTKKRFQHMCFPVNIAKFSRTPILTEHLCWLLLYLWSKSIIFPMPYILSLYLPIPIHVNFIFNSSYFILNK